MLQERLGQYEVIKVINFFRREAKAGRNATAAVVGGSRSWNDDKYFQPVLPDDELLFHDWEEEEGILGEDGPDTHMALSRYPAWS